MLFLMPSRPYRVSLSYLTVLQEMEERLEFLKEMNSLGKKRVAVDGNYKAIIQQEIAAKLNELKNYKDNS